MKTSELKVGDRVIHRRPVDPGTVVSIERDRPMAMVEYADAFGDDPRRRCLPIAELEIASGE